jgi:hypothetical protein
MVVDNLSYEVTMNLGGQANYVSKNLTRLND